MVDPSLLRQAADRGVTICFADLDGADGLWVPEERTVLVNRGLSDAAIAEVIEHELAHVMIDDQHADLDAGREVMVGRPPARRGLWPVVLTAASLVAVVAGITVGLAKASGNDKQEQVVGPAPPGLTADESGGPLPTISMSPSRLPDGRVVVVTVTLPAPTVSLPTATPTAGTVLPSPSAKPSAPRGSAGPATVGPSATFSPAPAQVSSSPPTPEPTPEPTETAPVTTTPAATGVGDPGEGGTGDVGDAGDAAATDAVPTAPAEVTVAATID